MTPGTGGDVEFSLDMKMNNQNLLGKHINIAVADHCNELQIANNFSLANIFSWEGEVRVCLIAKSYEFCKTFGIFILPTEITREWHLPGDWSPIAPGLNNLYQPASRAVRKWRGNGERMRKWREIYSLHFLIFSFFLSLYPFAVSKIVIFCRKMLNTALLSRMSPKT